MGFRPVGWPMENEKTVLTLSPLIGALPCGALSLKIIVIEPTSVRENRANACRKCSPNGDAVKVCSREHRVFKWQFCLEFGDAGRDVLFNKRPYPVNRARILPIGAKYPA